MNGKRITALIIIGIFIFLGYFVYASQSKDRPMGHFTFKLGLDLQGGTELTYKADVSGVDPSEVNERMDALREVVVRRVNSQEVAGALGVLDPVVQVEQSGLGIGGEQRLIVELPGVTDIKTATEMIGETPILEFKLVNSDVSILDEQNTATNTSLYIDIDLTGSFVENAQVGFDNHAGVGGDPYVLVDFNDDGRELFAQITESNVGEQLAIFLDGRLLSSPVIREAIPDGTARITGDFTPTEARELVRDLNLGALPVPIDLINTQTIGPTLGSDVLDRGVKAGFIGLGIVLIFMIIWYRLPGLVSGFALAGYVLMMLALFKLFSVTITASGIAGFILSIGMAVDANVLIFERIKEEMRSGRNLADSVNVGFGRAWPSIRDANISSMITAVVLFYAFGQTFVRGFAVVFFLGVLVSMVSAVFITRILLLALSGENEKKWLRNMFHSGFSRDSQVIDNG